MKARPPFWRPPTEESADPTPGVVLACVEELSPVPPAMTMGGRSAAPHSTKDVPPLGHARPAQSSIGRSNMRTRSEAVEFKQRSRVAQATPSVASRLSSGYLNM